MIGKEQGKAKPKVMMRYLDFISRCLPVLCALCTHNAYFFFVVVKSYLVQFSFVRTIQKFNKKVANLKELLHALKVIFSIRNLDDSLNNLKDIFTMVDG